MFRRHHRGTGRPSRPPRPPWAVPVLVGAALVVASACGGGSGASGDGIASASDGRTTTTADDEQKGEKDAQQAGLEYARCMREHGADVPDPEFDREGNPMFRIRGAAPSAAQEATPIDEEAAKACDHIMRDAIGDGAGPGSDPEEQDRALKFTQCMREHGIDMPDPDFSNGGIAIRIGEEGSPIDPSSETFKAAQQACKQFFGPGGGGAEEPVGEASLVPVPDTAGGTP